MLATSNVPNIFWDLGLDLHLSGRIAHKGHVHTCRETKTHTHHTTRESETWEIGGHGGGGRRGGAVWVGQPRKGAHGWVKSEAGPPGIKRPRRRRVPAAAAQPLRPAWAAGSSPAAKGGGGCTADVSLLVRWQGHGGRRCACRVRGTGAAAVPMPRQARAACRACARDGLGALLRCSRPVRPGLHECQTLDGGPRRRGS